MSVYYNDSDAFVCAWLRNLITAKLLPAGDVDERPIEAVSADDVRGYTQAHFFAGIGGWPYALQLAGWGDRPVWTGSCPCQPFSAAGKQRSHADERHLWPAWFRLIRECRPVAVFGEQVSGAAGLGWLDAVALDLEAINYAVGACVLGAHSVGAPHLRQRLYFVADATELRFATSRNGRTGAWGVPGEPAEYRNAGGLGDTPSLGREPCAGDPRIRRAHNGQGAAADQQRTAGTSGELADTNGGESSDGDVQRSREHGQRAQDSGAGRMADTERRGREGSHLSIRPMGQEQTQTVERRLSPWDAIEWLPCRDGKARPVEPGTFPLAHGVPQRVGRLRAYGNAIVPQVAAAFVSAYMECAP